MGLRWSPSKCLTSFSILQNGNPHFKLRSNFARSHFRPRPSFPFSTRTNRSPHHLQLEIASRRTQRHRRRLHLQRTSPSPSPPPPKNPPFLLPHLMHPNFVTSRNANGTVDVFVSISVFIAAPPLFLPLPLDVVARPSPNSTKHLPFLPLPPGTTARPSPNPTKRLPSLPLPPGAATCPNPNPMKHLPSLPLPPGGTARPSPSPTSLPLLHTF